MTDRLTHWRSIDGADNAAALRVQYQAAFEAFAELDRIGHLLLNRATRSTIVSNVESIVGIAMLRRAITLFLGVRELLESSLVDPAKPLARAYFELYLNHRCLAYGSTNPVSLALRTTPAEREPRACRYYVAAERRSIRTRAIILKPNSPIPPHSDEQRHALQQEVTSEIARLKQDFPAEWTYFGDLTESTVVRRVGGRDEKPWYAAEFLPSKVASLSALARAFGQSFEYEILYDIWSALAHSRGVHQDVTVENGGMAVHHPHDPTWFDALAY